MAGRASVVDVIVNRSAYGVIGGLEMRAPLGVEEERRLYPVIQQGRAAAVDLEGETVSDPALRRRYLRMRQEGQEAESLLLRATLGLVRIRVVERGYRFGNDELESAGVEGLVNALQRFDPEQGNRFSTYANYWIMKLVNQAIQQQAGLTDVEMRLILKFQKLERADPNRRVTKKDVATALQISQTRAQEVMQLSRELNARRFETTDLSDASHVKLNSDPDDAPAWVIDALREACGDDFDAFWQATFRTMSIEEIASAHGITRQGMAKRIDRCRRAVRESPQAERLQQWFDQQ
jgi:RNA polymerase sigma factor (sigma-70 family)